MPAIGDFIYGGYFAGWMDTTKGNIIAADNSQVGKRYMLIVAPKSLEQASLQYKTTGDVSPAATRTMWNGLTATQAMAADPATYPAADYCNGLTFPADGGSKWYLPAMDELELVYRNLKPAAEVNVVGPRGAAIFPGIASTYGVNNSSDPVGASYTAGSPAQTSVTLFKSGGTQALGGFYWSSTEYDVNLAWVHVFSGGAAGAQTYGFKNNNNLVRPVRRVEIVAPTAGSATGSTLWAGVALGAALLSGAAVGATSYTGAATGSTQRQGAAIGSTQWAGSASGSAAYQGAGTGATVWVGSATGTAPVIPAAQGSAAGTTTWAGAATGTAPTITPSQGTGAGSTAWVGSAAGSTQTQGTGTGSTFWDGTASGTAPSIATMQGDAAGQTAWTGAASGTAPTVGSAQGAASGATAWAGTANGAADNQGSAGGVYTFTGSASGSATRSGTAAGTWTYTGAAAGYAGSPSLAPVVRHPSLTLNIPTSGLTLNIPDSRLTLNIPDSRLELT